MKTTRKTKSEMLVLEALEKEPVITTRDLRDRVGLNQRTVNSVIRKLTKKGLVKKFPCLIDMRTKVVHKL